MIKTLAPLINSNPAIVRWGRGMNETFMLGIGDTLVGKLLLIDECLTPDSSRFWPADQYVVGKSPPSFDKQFVRDWLATTSWDKNSPPPMLPPEVVERELTDDRPQPRSKTPWRSSSSRSRWIVIRLTLNCSAKSLIGTEPRSNRYSVIRP